MIPFFEREWIKSVDKTFGEFREKSLHYFYGGEPGLSINAKLFRESNQSKQVALSFCIYEGSSLLFMEGAASCSLREPGNT